MSLTLYSRKSWCFCSVWEMGGETYIQREDFFFSYLLPGANECQRSKPHTSSSEMPLISCVSLARLRSSALCLKMTAWFSSRGLHPVTHLLYTSALIVLPCLLIIAWQLVIVHGVTWNEPKIHGICYITIFRRSKTCSQILRVLKNDFNLFTYNSLRSWLWSNDYRPREWTRRHEFKSWYGYWFRRRKTEFKPFDLCLKMTLHHVQLVWSDLANTYKWLCLFVGLSLSLYFGKKEGLVG